MFLKRIYSVIKASKGKLKGKLVLLGLLLLLTSESANAEISKSHQIMAGLLLHLASFTQWENLETDTIKVCLLGEDPFKTYIDKMIKRRPKNSAGQSIVLNRITDVQESKLRLCQIIYTQPQYYQKMWQAISPTEKVLLVSQSTNFITQGGMVNFSLKNKRVKLEVNLPAVKAAHLKISSELLKHAKVIYGKTHKNYVQEHSINAQY